MAKARRMKEKSHPKHLKNKQKSISSIYILLIPIVIILLACILFCNNNTNIVDKVQKIFENRPKEIPKEIKNEKSNDISDVQEKAIEPEKFDTTTPVKETQKVKGADYLEITELTIDEIGNGIYSVSSHIKNISKKTYKNISLRINLLDKNNKKISFLDYKIKKIKPNETSSTRAALKRDLSKYKNYSVELR